MLKIHRVLRSHVNTDDDVEEGRANERKKNLLLFERRYDIGLRMSLYIKVSWRRFPSSIIIQSSSYERCAVETCFTSTYRVARST